MWAIAPWRGVNLQIQDSFIILLPYSPRRPDADTYPDVHTLLDKRAECYTPDLKAVKLKAV
jgi:hypothetical protein